ncbi:MAG: GntR family transcriptional regulator [Rhodobacteraceae bacterium]|nr:GntR family transcriptional regulator [Paracoccaceae bacterium]
MNSEANAPTPIEPMRRETQAERFERIYKVIRERISVLEYGPGTVLNEGLLSEEFDVSRTPIRSVLQRLNYEGLVTTRNGVGTIVTEVDVKTFKDIYALRMRLAEDMSVLSPVAPSPQMLNEFHRLREKVRKLREGPPDHKAYARLCNAVHEQQLELTENKVLAEINDLLYYRAARVWLAFLPNIEWDEVLEILENEIADTTRALELGDMHGVGNVRRQNLFIILKTIGRFLVGV